MKVPWPIRRSGMFRPARYAALLEHFTVISTTEVVRQRWFVILNTTPQGPASGSSETTANDNFPVSQCSREQEDAAVSRNCRCRVRSFQSYLSVLIRSHSTFRLMR